MTTPTTPKTDSKFCLDSLNSFVRPEGVYESALSVVAKTVLIGAGIWGMHRMLLRNRTLPTHFAHALKVLVPTGLVLTADRIAAERLPEKKTKLEAPTVDLQPQLDAANEKLAKLRSAAQTLVDTLGDQVDTETLSQIKSALLTKSSDGGVVAWFNSWFS